MPRADELAALAGSLDLDFKGIGICCACLTFVAFALDDDDERAAKREARKMTPILWEEGLAQPALASVARAREEGMPGAPAALAELERDGGRSAVARAIVLRLAADMNARTRTELRAIRAARSTLHASSPDLN